MPRYGCGFFGINGRLMRREVADHPDDAAARDWAVALMQVKPYARFYEIDRDGAVIGRFDRFSVLTYSVRAAAYLATQWRERARTFRGLAERAETPEGRRILLSVAADCDKLADGEAS